MNDRKHISNNALLDSNSHGVAERLSTLGWSGIENSCRQVLSLIFFFVIVRFLHPHDLGVYALSVALNAISVIFIDEPIGESLVQKAEITTADWNTGFTVNLMIATCFLLLSLAASRPLAHLLGEPALQISLPALAFGSVIGAFGNIQKAYLCRALKFRLMAQTQLTAQLIGGVVATVLAVVGCGYWALIGNVLIVTSVFSVTFWACSPWKPRLHIDRAALLSRLPYAAYSVAIRSIYLLRDQSPLIIAGLFVDLTHVGFLSLALRVGRCLGQLFEEVTNRPLLSLVSREQHDPVAFGRVLSQLLTVVALFAVPAYVGLALVGPRVLPLIFGMTWAPAGELIPWVCIVLASWLLLHIVVVALRARALGRIALMLTAPAAVLDVVALAILAPFGLRWALIGWAARNLLSIPVAIWMLTARFGLRARELAYRFAPSVAGSLLMAGLLEYLERLCALGGSRDGIAIMVTAGSLLYCLVTGVCAIPIVGLQRIKRRFIAMIKVT